MIHFLFLQISLIIVNGISFAIVGIDKLQSKKGGWRVPESRLLLIAFLEPFGAYIGMILFRHKTRKIKFFLVRFSVNPRNFNNLFFYFINNIRFSESFAWILKGIE
jgi:uncharacterized membrane protein YsdA (DUF1294 family)